MATNIIPFPRKPANDNGGGGRQRSGPVLKLEDWDDGRPVGTEITEQTSDIEEALIHVRHISKEMRNRVPGTMSYAVGEGMLSWWLKELRSLMLAEQGNVLPFRRVGAA